MTDIINDDPHLQTTLDNFGPACRATLGKIKELVDQFVAMPFVTRKVTQTEITKSFELLQRIYTTTLTAPAEHSHAAIQYLVRRVSADRMGAFNPMRVNMTPYVEEGGSKVAMRYVADMNQLFGNLALSGTASELRRRIRLEPILGNVRAESQREAIRQYIASIDY